MNNCSTCNEPHDVDQLLARARANNPSVRYAKTSEGTAIGAWNEELKRFQIVAASANGTWFNMPYELLINDEPPKVVWIE